MGTSFNIDGTLCFGGRVWRGKWRLGERDHRHILSSLSLRLCVASEMAYGILTDGVVLAGNLTYRVNCRDSISGMEVHLMLIMSFGHVRRAT